MRAVWSTYLKILILTLGAFFLCAQRCQTSKDARQYPFDHKSAQEWIQMIAGNGHSFGSEAQKEIKNKITSALRAMGHSVYEQDFKAATPNPRLMQNPEAPSPLTIEKSGTNIIVVPELGKNSARCVVLLGSHYDTKEVEGISYLGANDGGSSTVALIEIARQFEFMKTFYKDARCTVGMVWFDGEEATLPDWFDGEKKHPAQIIDHTYGSRFFVEQTTQCKKERRCMNLPGRADPLEIETLILLDMIGHKNLRFSDDELSDQRLRLIRNQIIENWGWKSLLPGQSKAIEDDHLPFIRAKIPSLNLIDFENTIEWHNFRDRPEEISTNSMMKASFLALQIAWEIAHSPEKIH